MTDENISRLASWGSVSLKQYMQRRRDQRQWVSDVARKRGLMVTGEGGDLAYSLSTMMDGQTGWEQHPMSWGALDPGMKSTSTARLTWETVRS